MCVQRGYGASRREASGVRVPGVALDHNDTASPAARELPQVNVASFASVQAGIGMPRSRRQRLPREACVAAVAGVVAGKRVPRSRRSAWLPQGDRAPFAKPSRRNGCPRSRRSASTQFHRGTLPRSLSPVALAFPTTSVVDRMMRLANACCAFSPGSPLSRVARLRVLARVSVKASAPAEGGGTGPATPARSWLFVRRRLFSR